MNKITPDTLIPVSVFGVLAGGIFWLSVMYSSVNHANAEIKSIKEEINSVNTDRQQYRKRLWENQRSIDRRLSKIEGKLEYLVDTTDENNRR